VPQKYQTTFLNQNILVLSGISNVFSSLCCLGHVSLEKSWFNVNLRSNPFIQKK